MDIGRQNIDIGGGAFNKCPRLVDKEDFIIINGVVYDYFGKEQELKIPEGVTGLSTLSLSFCTQARSIRLPKSLRSIGRLALSSCIRLERIEIPEGVTNIGAKAFEKCGAQIDETTNVCTGCGTSEICSRGRNVNRSCRKYRGLRA